MKIGLVLNSGAGGSGVLATELGGWLAHQGCEVHFIADSVPFRLSDVRHDRVFFHRVSPMTYPLFEQPLTTLAEATTLIQVIEEHELDVVHAHYAIPHATASLMARAIARVPKPPPVVTTLHGTDVTLVGIDPSYLRVTQWSIDTSDAVTAVSKHLARVTVEEMGVRRDDIRVIYNAVDVARFSPALRTREDPNDGPGTMRMTHISNFRGVKRTEDVVRVFAKVAPLLPVELLMIGDGPERARTMALAGELGVADRVSFVGSAPRVEGLIANSDVFVLPSSKESFGLTALEAMASGVPVVASNIGGLPEVIDHGVTGFLHAVGDVEAMARSVSSLLTDRGLRDQMGRNGRDRAVRMFNESKVFPQYLDVYEQTIARRDAKLATASAY